jgi:hypothetical protein
MNSLDIENELTKILSDELTKEINSSILKNLLDKKQLRSSKIKNILKKIVK